MRLGVFAIVAEERGFSRALKLITQRRFFCGGSLLLSRRVIHLDGDSLILEPHSSTYRFPIALTGLINRSPAASASCRPDRRSVRLRKAHMEPFVAPANVFFPGVYGLNAAVIKPPAVPLEAGVKRAI